MKFFKTMLLIVALSVVGFVFPRTTSASTPLTTSTSTPLTPQQIEAKKQAVAKAAQERALAGKGQQTTLVNEGDILVETLLQYPVPWYKDSEVQKMYQSNTSKLSKEQHDYLLREYSKKFALQTQQEEVKRQVAALQGMLQPQEQLALSTQQEAGPSLTFEEVKAGAYERAKALWSMGGQKLQSTWEGVKGMGSRVWEGVAGEYGSSMGEYKYLLPGALVLSMPWAGIALGAGAGATALWGLGGSVAVLGVSNALDRLNHAYETGGYMSTVAYVNDVKNIMAVALNNQAAYPYYVSKVEALKSRNELYPIHKDKFGVANKAHTILLNEARATDQDTNKEKAFIQAVANIRAQYGYTSTPAEYMLKLEQGDALINAQALVSEYNRALNRKKMEEDNKKQMAAELAKKEAEAKKAAAATLPQQPAQQPQGAPVKTQQ